MNGKNLNRLISRMDNRMIKVITGVRRSGKSFLLFHFVFLDEIQLAISRDELKQKDTDVALYGILNGLLMKDNIDVYVTGSNSKLLATDVLTEFRGRGDEIHVLSLAFSEYFPAVSISKEDAWRDYLLYGGMPHILSLNNEE